MTSGSGQTENTRIRVYVYFQFTTSQSQKMIFKADLKWECPYFNSKFFLERFGQYLKKSKNGFLIVFSKSNVALAEVNCGDRLWVL